MTKGMIFNIQRFSLHDGPGIRTTIFFMGCPLQCSWCQNPEGINTQPVLFHYPNRCLGCGECVDQCPENAIKIIDGCAHLDRQLCTSCFSCAEICPTTSFTACGRKVSVTELVGEVLADQHIFEESGGGITLSGGEPLMQGEFALALLEALSKKGINSVIETCGHVYWPYLDRASEISDLIYYDLKSIDQQRCITYTSLSNQLVLDNLQKLIDLGRNVAVRMPLIPSVNDDYDSLIALAAHLKHLNINTIEVLPYHNLGAANYEHLGLNYRLDHISSPQAIELEKVQNIFHRLGIKMTSEGIEDDRQ